MKTFMYGNAKKIIMLLALFCIAGVLSGETFTRQVDSVCFKTKKYETWGTWGERKDVSLAVEIDLSNFVFRISGATGHENTFKNIDSKRERQDDEEDIYFIFRCIDSNSEECDLTMISSKNGMCILITYETTMIQYDLADVE